LNPYPGETDKPAFYPHFNDHSLTPPQVPDLLIVIQSGSLLSIAVVFPIGLTPGGINDNKLIELNEYRHPIVFEEKINEEVHGMKERPGDESERVVKRKRLLFSVVIILQLCLFLSGCALGHSAWWKEEVLLHDGQTIIVDRSQTHGGRAEIGQDPIAEHIVSFTVPGTHNRIKWSSGFDVNDDRLVLLALDIVNGVPYIVTHPAGCIAYNKWGRPNPPYVFFKYDGKVWQRILPAEYPSLINEANVVIGFSNHEERLQKYSQAVPAADIKSINAEAKNPHVLFHRVFTKYPLPVTGDTNVGCEEMVTNGKGTWLSIDWFSSEPSYEACLKVCSEQWFSKEYCPCDRLLNIKTQGGK